jgi:hypothetical protein
MKRNKKDYLFLIILIIVIAFVVTLFTSCEKELEPEIHTLNYDGVLYHAQGVVVTALLHSDSLYITVYGGAVESARTMFGCKKLGYIDTLEIPHPTLVIDITKYKNFDCYFTVYYKLTDGKEVTSFAFLTPR